MSNNKWIYYVVFVFLFFTEIPLCFSQGEDHLATISRFKSESPIEDLTGNRVEELFETLDESMGTFVKMDPRGEWAIEAGRPEYPIQIMEWGRDSMISILGLVATRRLDPARHILLKWARMEYYGQIPNVIANRADWHTTYNTSDAPLWFVESLYQYIKSSGDTSILSIKVAENKTVLQTLQYIFKKYSEPGIGVQGHPETGFVYVPPVSTWMDTDYTRRQGYPIEIQALMFNAANVMSELDPGQKEQYRTVADKIEKSANELFWNEAEDTVYDILGTDAVQHPQFAVPDPSVRCNQILAVHFGLFKGDRAEKIVQSTLERLRLPGSLRSLAKPTHQYEKVSSPDGRTSWKVSIPHDHSQASWPYATFHSVFPEHAPLEEWRQAYHNGTGWVWIYPFLFTSAVKIGSLSPLEALEQMTVDLLRFTKDPYTHLEGETGGSLPEVTDGEVITSTDETGKNYLYVVPKKCRKQAFSVASALWGLEIIQNEIKAADHAPPVSLQSTQDLSAAA
ncbi:MAG: hypothetical protein JW774_00395 [Candidatus Aureabacteria bacterium]|nr:hypothetical protein [Candidatus Auribacterota bacterium]